ncbi:MAG: hypothetical protein FWD52_07325 [Candidatus Bathyarchaeota archaeon]|nr:hypothetical protein [Candidatus Termiticorpusculum sp.]
MNSKDLLTKTRNIKILIDTKSFTPLITQGNRTAQAILEHNGSDFFEFIRTPFSFTPPLESLQKVPELKYVTTDDGWINELLLKTNTYDARISFDYRLEDVLRTAQKIFEHTEITEQQLERLLIVLIQTTFSRHNNETVHILVTNDHNLLKKRTCFEVHLHEDSLNIMTVEDTSIFLDLFLKYQKKYRISAHYGLNKWHWYLLSARLKLPHYNNVGDPMIDALFQRVTFVLMSIDEIGFQFYMGTNKDTMANMSYHFNYLISLLTGIFDNLALKTNTQLEINCHDLRKVCINNNNGKEFLKAVREKNPIIRNHICKYMKFINLIYEFRELVVHREGLEMIHFENPNAHWQTSFITVTSDVRTRLNDLRDRTSKFDPFTEWGFYQLHGDPLLEPYRFALMATRQLLDFVDTYLKLLGFQSFIESAKKENNEFTNTLLRFEKGHLGF